MKLKKEKRKKDFCQTIKNRHEAKKKKKAVDVLFFQRWRVLLKICHVSLFFSLSFVQVISTHFLHDFTRLSDPNEVGIVDEVREEDSEPKKRQLVSGSGVTAKCKGCVYLEGEFADEKCFRRQQTFFG